MDADEPAYIQVANRSIAYRLRKGASPTLLFLPGYASDMEGAKALALDAFADRRGLAMLRLDYSGTGSSAGRFEDGTLDRWLAEVLAAIDALTSGPLIIIGSSMGGWLALHATLDRPNRIKALVGIAAAPDFTDWGFTDAVAAEAAGIAPGFWESGQRLRLLKDAINVECPVRLIHGEHDRDVPVEIAMRTLAALRSADVQLTIIKGGGHRLSEPHEIDAILRTVAELLESNS
ncbi:alpha/beta hydrolase [Sphingomonas flavescens]|jgi:pimeloyl-ACP methyl ester carboxylesterase|uniref:alpha/beta fold hydrolase n=1 Tax=Sphingomonas flavescens TaxID=3132797 RepID=UPI002805A3A1|nr:alpha/beta hydrolase [Sphingomonas limnosediminicola]